MSDSENNTSMSYDPTAHLYSLFTGMLFMLTGVMEKQFRKRIYLEFLPLYDDQKILDICCANGYGTGILASTFPTCSVDALDLNSKMISFARRNNAQNKNIHFQVGDCTQLPYPDNTFDMITSFLALHELPTNLLSSAMREISRVLKLGGFLFVFELNIPNPIPLNLRWMYFVFRLFEDEAAARFMITEQETIIEPFGFKKLKKENYFLGFGNAFLFQKT
ncbi:MAG: class I SAM-dependent methyltransferase [Candidatus Heimdallarchaeota archaeon]